MKRPSRLIFFVVLATLLPPVIGAAVYLWSEDHAVLPGFSGCDLIRTPGAEAECYTRVLKDTIESDGREKASQKMDAHIKEHPESAGSCHMAWHPIGEHDGTAAAKARKLPKIPDVGSFCDDGYVHGLYLGYLEDVSTLAKLRPAAIALCESFTDLNEATNCSHSVGHAAARVAERDYGAVDDLCAAVGKSGPDGEDVPVSFDCRYGFWMELTLVDSTAQSDVEMNNCDATVRLMQEACYSFLPARVERLGGSSDEAANACRTYAKEESLRALCIRKLGEKLTSADECARMTNAADEKLCRETVASAAWVVPT